MMISESTDRIIYMDNNATTRVAPEVVELTVRQVYAERAVAGDSAEESCD